MTLAEIKELVQVVIDSGVAELEVTRGENKVRIRRNFSAVRQEYVVPSPPIALAAQPAESPAPPPPAAGPSAAAASAADEGLHCVRSPIVGTFYEAPAPDAPPFVRVGDRIAPGQVLCIIESMKLMNEIEAEVAGTVVGKLIENGRPVEYGEALFTVRRD